MRGSNVVTQEGATMLALNLMPRRRLVAAVVAVIAVSLAIVDPASAATYGYYWRP